jgi:hypothetical protein
MMAALTVHPERAGPMKRWEFSEGQGAYALRQADTHTPVGDVCRQLGVSEAMFNTGVKQYAHLGVSDRDAPAGFAP